MDKKNKKTILDKLKEVFLAEDGNMNMDYVDMKTSEDLILRFTPALEDGATVKIMNEEGTLIMSPEAEYVLEDGVKIQVSEEGNIVGIMEAEVAAEIVVDEEKVVEEELAHTPEHKEEEIKEELAHTPEHKEEKVVIEEDVKAEVVVKDLDPYLEEKEEIMTKLSALTEKFESLELKLSEMETAKEIDNVKLNLLNEAVQTFAELPAETPTERVVNHKDDKMSRLIQLRELRNNNK